VWRGAAALALCFGTAAAVWPEYDKPLISVPVIAAAVAGIVLGWIGAGRNREELVRDFTSNFWLRLHVEEPTNIEAVDLFEQIVPDLHDRRKIYRLETTRGEIYLLHAQRFVELLVSRSMDDLDKASEHAMALAWQRSFGEQRPELAPLLGKAFRETFKADLSGSMVKIISRVGDKLVQELAAAAEPKPPTTEAPFALEALTPSAKVRKRRPKK
jgi:hypothetical protein